MTTTDRNGMVVLSEEECRQRLGAGGIGRIAVTVGALPAIFPVNYATRGRDIYFRTGPGTKLAAASRQAVVAFEVDHSDAMSHTGWSVQAVGRAEPVTDPTELGELHDLPLKRWLAGDGTLVRVHLELLSGREIDHLVHERRHRNRGWALRDCPSCGSDALRVVTDGEHANFACTSCMKCWHVELGHVREVVWETCPGCAIRSECRAGRTYERALQVLAEPLDD